MKDEKYEDVQIFQCGCGEYSFVALFDMDWGEGQHDFCLDFIDEPCTFWQKLKFVFKKDKYVRSIILSKENVRDIETVESIFKEGSEVKYEYFECQYCRYWKRLKEAGKGWCKHRIINDKDRSATSCCRVSGLCFDRSRGR